MANLYRYVAVVSVVVFLLFIRSYENKNRGHVRVCEYAYLSARNLANLRKIWIRPGRILLHISGISGRIWKAIYIILKKYIPKLDEWGANVVWGQVIYFSSKASKHPTLTPRASPVPFKEITNYIINANRFCLAEKLIFLSMTLNIPLAFFVCSWWTTSRFRFMRNRLRNFQCGSFLRMQINRFFSLKFKREIAFSLMDFEKWKQWNFPNRFLLSVARFATQHNYYRAIIARD